jgi:hypothetical protein
VALGSRLSEDALSTLTPFAVRACRRLLASRYCIRHGAAIRPASVPYPQQFCHFLSLHPSAHILRSSVLVWNAAALAQRPAGIERRPNSANRAANGKRRNIIRRREFQVPIQPSRARVETVRKRPKSWLRRTLTLSFCEFTQVTITIRVNQAPKVGAPQLTDTEGKPLSSVVWRLLFQSIMHGLDQDRWTGAPAIIDGGPNSGFPRATKSRSPGGEFRAGLPFPVQWS